MSQLAGVRIGEAFAEVRPEDDIPRTFERLDDGRYRMALTGICSFEIDRLRRERHELKGELIVRCGLAGAQTYDGVLSHSDFNMSSARVRQQHAKLLEVKSDAKTLKWDALLEEFCQRVLAAEREGQPATRLRDYAKPDPEEDFDVEGVRLLRAHPVIVFGDGGTAKSLTALYLGGRLEQREVRVLYADWEFSGEDHRDRLERLFGEDMPGILYARCDRPLVHEADRLRRIVKQESIGYVIFDSIAFACDGPPESAEVAAAYFRAVRQIGVGSLHVAHTTKGEHSDKKPFGSAFWHNGARRTWFVQPTEATGGSSMAIGLFERKRNVGPPLPPVGFQICFDDEHTDYTRIDVADIPELSARLPLWLRMKKAVEQKPKTLATLAQELDAKINSIEKAAKRKSKTFTKIDGEDGVARIALVV